MSPLEEQLRRVAAMLQELGPEGLQVTASQLEELRAAAGGEELEPAPVVQAPRQCLAAALSTLTRVPAGELALPLPEDATAAWLQENGPRLWTWVAGELAARGWLLVPLVPGEVPAGFAVAVGILASGAPHAVVYRDGVLWHDPAPLGGGLAEVRTFSAVIRLGIGAST